MNLSKITKTFIIATILTVCNLPFTAMAEEPGSTVEVMTVHQALKLAKEPGAMSGAVQVPIVLMEQLVETSAAVQQGRGYMAYTEEDLYILAHVICGEAQSYSDEEQLYVGSVVLNRVSSPSFPNTIRDVVFQQNQYACTRDGNYYRSPTERNWANARYLLEQGSVLPGNVVFQAGRRQGKGVYVKTAKHYYCYQ